MRSHDGFTLLELLVVLGLLAILLGIAAPRAARWRDAANVRAARDEIASAVAWTRLAAATRGGAVFYLHPASASFWTGGASLDTLPDGPRSDLRARYRVTVDAGSDRLLALPFDALGIGRAANRTIRLRRGDVEAGVTISAYGRVRRW